MKGYPKPKPLTFTELEARVKAHEAADRSDASLTTSKRPPAYPVLDRNRSAQDGAREADGRSDDEVSG